MKNKTYTICAIGVLTALYVVLSAFLKINIVGNIQLDLGYLVFAVALCEFGTLGVVVGAVGCALESILFSAYGFSISWVVANTVIGLVCGTAYRRFDNLTMRIGFTVSACLVGLAGIKTGIECALYSIPLEVKLPKNVVAFAIDTGVMIAGLVFYYLIERKIRRKNT